jgi:hypothetical protein
MPVILSMPVSRGITAIVSTTPSSTLATSTSRRMTTPPGEPGGT